jgi:hypothetical protein
LASARPPRAPAFAADRELDLLLVADGPVPLPRTDGVGITTDDAERSGRTVGSDEQRGVSIEPVSLLLNSDSPSRDEPENENWLVSWIPNAIFARDALRHALSRSCTRTAEGRTV